MARYPFEEFTRVWLVPSIANIAAPTVAEINAGVDVTCFLTKDGLNPGGSTNKVDQGSLCSHVDGETIGTVKYDMTLKGYRDAAGDTFWDLVDWAEATSVVVRRGVAFATAVAAAQKVEVYKGQTGEPVPMASAANANQTFEVSVAVASANLKAVVAA